MKLTKEELEILAKAKKIEAETKTTELSAEATENINENTKDEKDLGSAGSVLLANPRIANFSGRSLLDNTGPLLVDTTNELEMLKLQLKELQRMVKGGE